MLPPARPGAHQTAVAGSLRVAGRAGRNGPDAGPLPSPARLPPAGAVIPLSPDVTRRRHLDPLSWN
jgi:hypothetical protein